MTEKLHNLSDDMDIEPVMASGAENLLQRNTVKEGVASMLEGVGGAEELEEVVSSGDTRKSSSAEVKELRPEQKKVRVRSYLFSQRRDGESTLSQLYIQSSSKRPPHPFKVQELLGKVRRLDTEIAQLSTASLEVISHKYGAYILSKQQEKEVN